ACSRMGWMGGVVRALCWGEGKARAGVTWARAGEGGRALLVRPLIGFVLAGLLLLLLKAVVREPRLYKPPEGDDRPPSWIRGILIATCGGGSFAHGSNDRQKGVGLVLPVLIGFLPFPYAGNLYPDHLAAQVRASSAPPTHTPP